MTDLTLTTHTRRIHEIVNTVLDANLAEIAPDAFVFTPAEPIPARRLAYPDADTVVWEQDGPTFEKIKRVRNWGWLRKIAHGYGEPALLHPAIGTAFHVRTWRYQPSEQGNARRSGNRVIPHDRFGELMSYRDCIFIARLSDGRYFADAWASRSVLHDSLSRWRNAQGYLVDWQDLGMHDPPTCAIGGADWQTIPTKIAEHRQRVIRERERRENDAA